MFKLLLSLSSSIWPKEGALVRFNLNTNQHRTFGEHKGPVIGRSGVILIEVLAIVQSGWPGNCVVDEYVG